MRRTRATGYTARRDRGRGGREQARLRDAAPRNCCEECPRAEEKWVLAMTEIWAQREWVIAGQAAKNSRLGGMAGCKMCRRPWASSVCG